MATLSSHCRHRPSAFRRRAWLASLEAAYLLEVSRLPAILSCPSISDEAHRSASLTPCEASSAFSSLRSLRAAGHRRAPLRRFETRNGAPSASPPAVRPLVRLSALRSIDMRPARGVLLVPHSRFALGVSVGAGGFFRSPSPACLRKRVHPPVSFTPLQSPTVPCPPDASRRRAPPLGSAFPLRDISPRRPLRDGASILRHLAVFGVSHALDGFRRRWPRGFISPHYRVQGFPSGVISSHTAVLSSSLRSCPLVG
jgi:hypothetical protein